jgi:polar amino acid transport system substrate-binding protein
MTFVSPIVAAFVATVLVFAESAKAQAPSTAKSIEPLQTELVIGTKEAPPFAMKLPDGSWRGISIDLWRRVADDLHIGYRFAEEPTVQGLIDGVATGKFDVAVAALTVTAARSQVLDFTDPFYVTGLGIAIPAGGEVSWMPIIRTMTSFGFAQAIMALIALALAVGLLVWFFERRHNEHFGGSVTRGLSSGVWWSTVAMTQRSTGSVDPRTMPGRIVAILWMVGSVITVAVFTASLTSALTIKHLQGVVHGVGDLSNVHVGAVGGTSTEETLARLRISYRSFDTPQDGLKALHQNAIDAFVYDKPLLGWLVQQDFSSSIELVDATFDPQQYAFALPNGSSRRKAINVAIQNAIHSEWWEQTIFRYLGRR